MTEEFESAGAGAALLRGAYLFATIVWDWPVVGAVLFAAPGLLLLIPFVVASLVDALRGVRRSG